MVRKQVKGTASGSLCSSQSTDTEGNAEVIAKTSKATRRMMCQLWLQERMGVNGDGSHHHRLRC
ncbi:MAG: hypothetical protein ACLSG9_07720 [Eubacterium sp.]